MELVTLKAGNNHIDFGTLLIGDANNDNIINIRDFSLLAAGAGRPSTRAISNAVAAQSDIIGIYVSSHANGCVGGVSGAHEDIVIYDQDDSVTTTYTWTRYFDGSDVGLTDNVDAMLVLDEMGILMSFENTITLSNVDTVEAQDIIRFAPIGTVQLLI
jgi:hypothetical protein